MITKIIMLMALGMIANACSQDTELAGRSSKKDNKSDGGGEATGLVEDGDNVDETAQKNKPKKDKDSDITKYGRGIYRFAIKSSFPNLGQDFYYSQNKNAFVAPHIVYENKGIKFYVFESREQANEKVEGCEAKRLISCKVAAQNYVAMANCYDTSAKPHTISEELGFVCSKNPEKKLKALKLFRKKLWLPDGTMRTLYLVNPKVSGYQHFQDIGFVPQQ